MITGVPDRGNHTYEQLVRVYLDRPGFEGLGLPVEGAAGGSEADGLAVRVGDQSGVAVTQHGDQW